VHDEAGWKRLLPNAFDGVPGEEIVTAWEAILTAHQLDSEHTVSFAWTFRQRVFPYFGFTPRHPHLLHAPASSPGRWRKSDQLPPLP